MFASSLTKTLFILTVSFTLTACGGAGINPSPGGGGGGALGGGSGDGTTVVSPDLVPAAVPGQDFWHYEIDGGDLIVYVENIGTATAGSSYVSLHFTDGPVVEVPTPTGELVPGAISPGLRVAMPAGVVFDPSAEFTIRADTREEVAESDETNNEVDQVIIG